MYALLYIYYLFCILWALYKILIKMYSRIIAFMLEMKELGVSEV